jgi:hypothetical protein
MDFERELWEFLPPYFQKDIIRQNGSMSFDRKSFYIVET